MQIKCYKCKSKQNDINKVLTDEKIITARLIYPLSIETPSLKLDASGVDNFNQYNYFSLVYGGVTYYYYKSNAIIESNIITLSLTEDVLMTRKADLLASKAHIIRSSSHYNRMIPDSLIINTSKINRDYRKLGDAFDIINQFILTVGG